jgi:hypothetical protein
MGFFYAKAFKSFEARGSRVDWWTIGNLLRSQMSEMFVPLHGCASTCSSLFRVRGKFYGIVGAGKREAGNFSSNLASFY